GVRVRDRGDVGDGALGAARVRLEAGLGDVLAAAAAAVAPRALCPAARRARLRQRGAADADDVRARGRVLRAVAGVTGARGDDDAGVVVVLRVVGGDGAVLAAAVAVRDGVGAERGGRVHGRAEVGS